LSIVQGPVSVAPCQTPNVTIRNFCIAVFTCRRDRQYSDCDASAAAPPPLPPPLLLLAVPGRAEPGRPPNAADPGRRPSNPNDDEARLVALLRPPACPACAPLPGRLPAVPELPELRYPLCVQHIPSHTPARLV
jgi:hypothetical protein